MSHKATVIAISAAMTLLAGCAWQSDVLKAGDDTYHVSVNASPIRGGVMGAREMAITAANEKCDSLGKKSTITDIKEERVFPINGLATVTFTCK